MPPNPSKIMAPVQMQGSPIQAQTKDQLILARGSSVGREKAGRVKGKVKERNVQNRQTVACKAGPGRMSPKSKSPQNVCKLNEPTEMSKTRGKSGSISPPVKQGQGCSNGRRSISPDGSSYAGAKFSEAPTPDLLPMPPACWLSSFSSSKKRVQSCPQLQVQSQACKIVADRGHSAFDTIARDLKMMLKVEA